MRRFLILSACIAVVTGCNSTTADTSIAPYTDLHVDPSSFQGDLPCGTAPGSMRAYVAKLWDVTGQATVDLSTLTPTVVSQPTLCSQSAAFSAVEPGRYYVATIDAYDVAAPCLDEASCSLTTPLASTNCGFGAGPDDPPPVVEGELTGPPDATVALYLRRVLIRGCRPLARTSPAITLDTRTVVAGVGCGVDANHVERLRVVRDGSSSFVDLFCGDALPLSAQADATVSLSIFAFAHGADVPRWGTTCAGDAKAGIVCGKLSERGSIAVVGADVCASSDGTFKARVLGIDRTVGASCGATAVIDDLPVAGYTVVVEGGASATCKATVQPGQSTVATCAK